MRTAYQYRLRPTASQIALMEQWLELLRKQNQLVAVAQAGFNQAHDRRITQATREDLGFFELDLLTPLWPALDDAPQEAATFAPAVSKLDKSFIRPSAA